MKTLYTTHGTCSRSIEIELSDGMISSVNFIGGCTGNTGGLSALLAGMPVEDVINKLKGIACRGNTSCPDQLAQALEAMLLQQAS